MSDLEDEYHENKSEKFMIIFAKTWAEKRKFIINISDLSVFPIFVIFIFKLDANFPGLQHKSVYFFQFYSFFCFLDFGLKLGIQRIKLQKIRQFQS